MGRDEERPGLTPAADAPQPAFELPITVRAEDIDELGHVNNVVYLGWVQEVAKGHWFAVTTPEEAENLVWVAIRHELDYRKPAFDGDHLVGRTWIGEAGGVKCERFVEIRNRDTGDLLMQCRSVWVAVDRRSGRPRRFDPAVMDRFRRPVS
jgi:acyl-CoA thioester hydrolase